MYCPSCGTALSRQMKYCNLCGAQLPHTKDKPAVEATEKRLDEYLDGLFWMTVFGLGLILGGMVLIKKVHLSDTILIAYLILSSGAFLVNFVLSLLEISRMKRSLKEGNYTAETPQLDTNKLSHANEQLPLEAVASVTEDTTRAFEPSPTILSSQRENSE